MLFKKGTYPTSVIVRKSYHSRYKFLNDTFGVGLNVLDVGCGFGHLAKVFASSREYLGIDPRTDVIRYCKNELGATFIESMFSSHIVNKKYDLILSLTVLDEVKNKSAFLNELKACLDLNGSILITVRNSACRLHRKKSVMSQSGEIVEDLSCQDYRKLLHSHGFNVEDFVLPRPWITSLDFNGIKNFLATLHDSLVNQNDLKYTCGFLLKLQN